MWCTTLECVMFYFSTSLSNNECLEDSGDIKDWFHPYRFLCACASGAAGMEIWRLCGWKGQDSPSAQDLQSFDREGTVCRMWHLRISNNQNIETSGLSPCSPFLSLCFRRKRFTDGQLESPWRVCWQWDGASTGPRMEKACLNRGRMRKWEKYRRRHRYSTNNMSQILTSLLRYFHP